MPNLSRHKRNTKGVPLAITDRDIEILKAVNRCRYMRTGQVKRLVFPENKSTQSCQRRLKRLFHKKFLGRIMPFVQIGNGGTESACYLDEDGIALLKRENGDETFV
jgi:hypothetical protein